MVLRMTSAVYGYLLPVARLIAGARFVVDHSPSCAIEPNEVDHPLIQFSVRFVCHRILTGSTISSSMGLDNSP